MTDAQPKPDNDARRAVQVISNPVLRGSLQRALAAIKPIFDSTFDHVDDALFDIAERAESNADQTRYFDGMRRVRKERSKVVATFGTEMKRRFILFANGKLPPADDMSDDGGEGSSREMSLVDDDELEERLALKAMQAKAEGKFQREFHALNRRLAVLVGLNELDTSVNPLAPDHIGNSVKIAFETLDLDIPVLLIIYKLCDKHLFSGLGQLYSDLNGYLASNDVLPNLSHRVASPTRGSTARRQAPSADSGEAEVDDDRPSNSETELDEPVAEGNGRRQSQAAEQFHQIWEKLRPQSRGQPAAAMNAPAPESYVNALALVEMQVRKLLEEQRGSKPQALQPAEISQDFRSALGSIDGHDDSEQGKAADDTIDLVGMLFDFVVHDRNLPESIRAMLSRLQIPYLKLALNDRAVFANEQHPARVLLNELASASTGWSADSAAGEALMEKLEETVDALVTDFDGKSVQPIEAALTAFRAFSKKRGRKAAVAEKRTTEATRGKEKLLQARRVAAEVTRDWLADESLPDLVNEILKKPWANVLVLTHLRHGSDSPDWKKAIKFGEQLVWCAQPKESAADVARLQSMLPDMSRQLKSGLEMVAYNRSDIEELFEGLKRLFQQQVDQRYRPHLHMPSVQSSGPLKPITHFKPIKLPAIKLGDDTVEDITSSADGKDSDTPRVPDNFEKTEAGSYLIGRIKGLPIGTWFEFTDEDGANIRGKLSWRSPITQKLLFVNEQGVKLADTPLAELAADVKRGQTRILDSSPVFERAMGAIANKLDPKKAESDKPQVADGEEGPVDQSGK